MLKLETGTRLENTPSVRLLEKLGFHPIGQGEFRLSKEERFKQVKASSGQLPTGFQW
jgi:RimJ/RimL family protein N-acetyltransferase